MALHPISSLLGNPYIGVVIVAVIAVIAIALRLYLMRRPGAMRAKCPKCGAVFDASRSFPGIHLGTYKQLKCPSCGRISFMNTHVKDPITWRPEEKKADQPQGRQLTDEELEKKRIEESKYETS
jgi:ribosomal protein S27AE